MGVDRPAQAGDYVSIDLSASVDGKPVEDAQASGISYEVGSGSVLDGLDEALTGMSAGDAGTFTAQLAGGEHAGKQAEVAVTVHSVKVKELPELDDEFAQSASEYDTLGEFRAGTRTRLESVKRMQQAARPGTGHWRCCWTGSTSRCPSGSSPRRPNGASTHSTSSWSGPA